MKKSSYEATRAQKILAFSAANFFLVLAGLFFSPENLAFFNVTPHPYIVVSIVLSSFYGFSFSLNHSLFSSLIYLLLLHYQTDYQSVDTILSLEFMTLPILMVMISTVLGELKTRSVNHLRKLEMDLDEVGTSNTTLAKKIKELTADNYDIKKKLLNKLETFKSVLTLTRGFQSLRLEELVKFYFETTCQQVNAKAAVFYQFDGSNELSVQYSIGDKDYPKNLSLDIIDDELVLLALEDRGTVSIRELYHSKDYLPENRDQAILVSPIYLNEDLFGLFIVYDLPFLDYVPSNFALLEILTRWLERSLSYSKKFSLLTTNSIFDNNLEVYTYQYFKEKLIEDFEAAKRFKIDHQLLTVQIKNLVKDNLVEQLNTKRLVAQILKNKTRKTDIICEGGVDSEFCILVPFADKEQINKLKIKLEGAIKDHQVSENLQEKLAVNIVASELEQACALHGLIGDGSV